MMGVLKMGPMKEKGQPRKIEYGFDQKEDMDGRP
jgi:hypothetical protein